MTLAYILKKKISKGREELHCAGRKKQNKRCGPAMYFSPSPVLTGIKKNPIHTSTNLSKSDANKKNTQTQQQHCHEHAQTMGGDKNPNSWAIFTFRSLKAEIINRLNATTAMTGFVKFSKLAVVALSCYQLALFCFCSSLFWKSECIFSMCKRKKISSKSFSTTSHTRTMLRL